MRFIQVGVGGFGGLWVDRLKENPDVQVVGMVDVSDKALEAACRKAGYAPGICFHSLHEALNKVEADAVVVVTPPRFHRAPVVEALKAGLHVISEKPMAESLADCVAILKAARASKRVCVISQNYRYGPQMWTLAKLVREGGLGAIGQVKLDFYLGMDFGGGFRHEMDFPLIVDMSIHHFDLIRFVTGLDPVSVSGSAWNPPWSNYRGDCSSTALFEMHNGARVLYNASWCAKGQFSDWNGNWQIECENGTVAYQNGELRVYRVPKLYKVAGIEIAIPQAPPKSGQAYVLDEFIRCVKGKKRPATCVDDNIRSVSMVFAAVKAMKTGKPVRVLTPEVERLLRKRK
jgi:predicted dehydrogenase